MVAMGSRAREKPCLPWPPGTRDPAPGNERSSPRRLPLAGLRAGVIAPALFLGCAALPTAPVRPPVGFLVTSVDAPLTVDFTDNTVALRSGRASTFFFMEPFFGTTYAWGDASINAAVKRGGLKQLSFADYHMVHFLGIFGQFTVTAWGE
jgi:hypothetical protein